MLLRSIPGRASRRDERFRCGLLLAAASLVLPACGGGCDLSAIAALSLTIVDADTDAPIRDATIVYSVDGDEQDPATETPERGEGVYTFGYELAGHYVLDIEAPEHVMVHREYHIEDGKCHVDGQQDTVEMEPG